MADANTETRKRARSEGLEDDEPTHEGAEAEQELDDDDEDVGPMPLAPNAVASRTKRKKRRETPHERLLLDQLPSAGRYYRSFMHRDTVSWVTVTRTNFLITASVDGHLKFWKKKDPDQGPGIEFAKHYRAHLSPILGVSASADGAVYATIAADGTKGSAKVFDVANFDMINMLKLPFTPAACCWVHKPGQAATVLAIAERGSPSIHLYDGRGSGEAIAVVDRVHRFPVNLLSYNPQHDCVVSADAGGMIEYWRPSAPFDLPTSISWSMKSQTDLFVLRKSKTVASALTVSPGGTHFALTSLSSQGHLVRIFAFDTGRLLRAYDEGTAAAADMQQAGTADWRLDEMEFGRRLAAERELAKACDANDTPGIAGAPTFDQSGNFLIYPSLLGIKVVNIHTNKVVRVLGKDENNRFLQLALFQSVNARKPLSSLAMAASDNPLLQEGGAADPTLFCTAFKRSRFYFFNRLEPESDEHAKHADRDIFNEKPTREEQAIAAPAPASSAQTGTSAVIHTTLGDIHCRLFPDLAPKTVENFASLARNGYYAGVIFHRVIKKFMLQTGDPLGNGTGGESIWGGHFEDEFHPSLRHDRPYCLSMANAGPNTNGSQFFITTTSCPWLDNKHTIFGRCTSGFDVVHNIENVRCDKTDKPLPEYEVKITSISIA